MDEPEKNKRRNVVMPDKLWLVVKTLAAREEEAPSAWVRDAIMRKLRHPARPPTDA